MKAVLYILFFFLVTSVVLGTYEDILNGPAELVDGVQLYIQKPFLTYEGSEFEVVIVPVVEEQGIDFSLNLYKNGKKIPKKLDILNISQNKTLVIKWIDSIDEDTNYKIKYSRVGGESSEIKFVVKAEKKIIVNRFLQEKIYLPKKKTNNQRTFLIDLLNKSGFFYSLENFLEEETAAKNILQMDKKVFLETVYYNDNSSKTRTVVVIEIKALEEQLDVKLIETIPKDFAFNASNILFNDGIIQSPIILENDPVVMWHFQNINAKKIQYSIEGNATLTGNTILLTSVVQDDLLVQEKNSSSRKIILPLLLIPLVAGILIFFSKFSRNPKKKKYY